MSEERVILHSDINHCYAQIEEMKYPPLREVPMAVGGNEEKRHGIILAKNDLAKTYHIKTGESLREAYAKCPHLCILQPNFEEYMYYTEKVKAIYREYSDQVESFGLDEAWIDISNSMALFGSGFDIAKTIQQRVLHEVGLSVSIGVSFNKIFAKLGSDMDKQMGLTIITKVNFKEKVWGLPVEDLLYVGRSTKEKLAKISITTIGDLARLPLGFIRDYLGKMGEMIWCFANGQDESEVSISTYREQVKSVGNAITSPKDITTFEEAKMVYYVLVESVASRLKEKGIEGNVIGISLRNKDLKCITRRRKIKQATNLVGDIIPHVLNLLSENYDFNLPLRTIGVTLSGIEVEGTWHQLNIFENEEEHDKRKLIEETMDSIRSKYGFSKAKRCILMLDQELTGFNPKEDHVIYPVAFLKESL